MRRFWLKRIRVVNFQEKGSALLGALIISAIGMLLLAGTLNILSSAAHVARARKSRSDQYYEVERSFNLTVSWLRQNAPNLITPFLKANFYTNFQQGTPGVGPNDNTAFTVTTRIKLNNGSTPVLTNDKLLAESAFPMSANIYSGAAFDPISIFAAGDFGNAIVRVTLLDAIPSIPAKDFGDTDDGNPKPETNFNPIFRIDAMTDLFEGAHVFGYLVGDLSEGSSGFYGRGQFRTYSDCDSYESDKGAYGGKNRKANCHVDSQGMVYIRKNKSIYGSVNTNSFIAGSKAWSGKICANFKKGCPIPGNACEGINCQVPDLPAPDKWSSYCPADQGNISITKDTILTVKSDAPSDKCWKTVTVKKKSVLTLHTTDFPYFIKTLRVEDGSRVEFIPDGTNETIELVVDKFDKNRFDGLKIYNVGNKPYQLSLHYYGKSKLTLFGKTDMFLFITAPAASVSATGKFDFFGGIKAKSINFDKGAKPHLDESFSISSPTGIDFEIKGISQRYR